MTTGDSFGHTNLGDEKKKEDESPALDKMLKTRTVVVSKGVDAELAKSVLSQLFLLEQEDPNLPVTVIVNSPGGSADSGFAIYDALRFIKCPVRTVTMGMSASAAVMISLAGDKGSRFMTPTARFLLHQPSISTMGQASDLEIVSKEIDRIRAVYNQIVSECTGKPADQIAEDSSRDFWLSPEDALAYGLVDKIVTSRSEIE